MRFDSTIVYNVLLYLFFSAELKIASGEVSPSAGGSHGGSFARVVRKQFSQTLRPRCTMCVSSRTAFSMMLPIYAYSSYGKFVLVRGSLEEFSPLTDPVTKAVITQNRNSSCAKDSKLLRPNSRQQATLVATFDVSAILA